MDITETFAARVGLTSGVSVALVGRWVLGLLRGQMGSYRYRALPGTAWRGSHRLGVSLSGRRGRGCTAVRGLRPCGGLQRAHPSPLGRCDLWGGNLAAALAAAAAGLWLGLVRAARAARVQCPAGQHGLARPLRARGRGRDGAGIEPLAAWRTRRP